MSIMHNGNTCLCPQRHDRVIYRYLKKAFSMCRGPRYACTHVTCCTAYKFAPQEAKLIWTVRNNWLHKHTNYHGYLFFQSNSAISDEIMGVYCMRKIIPNKRKMKHRYECRTTVRSGNCYYLYHESQFHTGVSFVHCGRDKSRIKIATE